MRARTNSRGADPVGDVVHCFKVAFHSCKNSVRRAVIAFAAAADIRPSLRGISRFLSNAVLAALPAARV